jgi:hypothetical protein
MSEPDTSEPEPIWPTCDGCGRKIITAQPGVEALWRIVVKPPAGVELDGGAFCLSCATHFAMLGLKIHGDVREIVDHVRKRRLAEG